MNEGQLAGRAALVTGAGRGIGRAIALRLAAEGAAVAVNDIDAESAAVVCEEIVASGGRAAVSPGDISIVEGSRSVAFAAVEAFGGLSILVNNAGVEHRASIRDHHPDDWERVLRINLQAPFLMVQATADALVRSGNGAVVNIASVAIMGFFGQPAYDASKGGLLTLTRSLANELGREGVRVNAVCPGFIETDMVVGDEEILRIGERQVRTQPLQRMGSPAEVAAAVAWLASDQASYVTGASLYVDGGWSRR